MFADLIGHMQIAAPEAPCSLLEAKLKMVLDEIARMPGLFDQTETTTASSDDQRIFSFYSDEDGLTPSAVNTVKIGGRKAGCWKTDIETGEVELEDDERVREGDEIEITFSRTADSVGDIPDAIMEHQETILDGALSKVLHIQRQQFTEVGRARELERKYRAGMSKIRAIAKRRAGKSVNSFSGRGRRGWP